jgi:glycosyltransferase involved in cell wall biosynthesis
VVLLRQRLRGGTQRAGPASSEKPSIDVQISLIRCRHRQSLWTTTLPAQRRTRILVVQRHLTHYRLPFFETLRRTLAERGCELDVAYGDGTPEETAKQDDGELAWGTRLPTTRYFAGGRVCWQPFGAQLAAADLVVMTAENKLIYNLNVQLRERLARVVLWGHGGNLQGRHDSLRERFKRRVARRADWWLAYTEFSRPLILESGFPAERITVLDNAVDTRDMLEMRARVTPASSAALRAHWGLGDGPVGIFVGSIYSEKRIEFLLDAAARVQAEVPGFQFVIVGAGVQQPLVEAFCRSHPWARYVGVLLGPQKIEAMALSSVMLNPGLVGLGVLDSFVCEVPMVTTECGLHSPEISYLAHGHNGLMTPNTMDAYVAGVLQVLRDPRHRATLVQGCRESAAKYTVENMARNFSDGVQACLSAPIRRF